MNESKKVHISGDMAPVETVALAGITWLNGKIFRFFHPDHSFQVEREHRPMPRSFLR